MNYEMQQPGESSAPAGATAAQETNTMAPSASTSSTSGKPTPPIDEVIALAISDQDNSHSKKLLTQLNSLTKPSLLSYTSDGLDPLTVLNPVTHSLAYLFFITARCQDASEDTALQLFGLLSHFIQQFDPEQVRLSPSRFGHIGKALLHLSKVLYKPLLPLQMFVIAMQRYAESPNTMTSLHAPFVQACISAKTYRFPLFLLDNDIETIDTTKHDLNIQSFLQYYYYGAIIYIGNKNYDRALDFLTIVISAPTQKAISAIQVAAYKKFVLVSLIYQGQLKPLPKYTAQGVEKVCKTQSQPYTSLLKAFNDTDLDLFQEIASNHSGVFESDKHIGLVKQCFQSLRRKKIKELTKVYITVGLIEMANKIGTTPEELELVLIEMITQRQVAASISVTEEQLVKMVHFIDEDESATVKLEDRIAHIASINERVSYMDKLEGLNRDFQTKYMTLSANGGQMASVAAFDEDFDIPIDE